MSAGGDPEEEWTLIPLKHVLAGGHPFGRRRGRILGISLNRFRSTQVHPTLSPKRSSLDLAKASPANNFEETHLAEILEIIAGTDILKYLHQRQVMVLKSSVWDCKGDDVHIKRLLLAWFDIFNSAFFGGSLKVLQRQLRLMDDESSFKDLGSFGLGPFKGAVGLLYIKKTQKKLGAGNPRADSLLPIALAIQDQVRWPVDTGISDSVEIDMERHNWVATPEQARKWGLYRGDDFIQREAKKRRLRAYIANNPLPRIWQPQSRHQDFDAANEQLFREVLLVNENETS